MHVGNWIEFKSITTVSRAKNEKCVNGPDCKCKTAVLCLGSLQFRKNNRRDRNKKPYFITDCNKIPKSKVLCSFWRFYCTAFLFYIYICFCKASNGQKNIPFLAFYRSNVFQLQTESGFFTLTHTSCKFKTRGGWIWPISGHIGLYDILLEFWSKLLVNFDLMLDHISSWPHRNKTPEKTPLHCVQDVSDWFCAFVFNARIAWVHQLILQHECCWRAHVYLIWGRRLYNHF